ncbi:MAG: hypothetical protein DRQ55_17535 [Planctomycetota bacterium]|nr:MAG: hypothetical protein DRQ55_17535 [Planctomycetota bacterium]
MTLATEVQARYPATRLVQLTNAGEENATVVDATILGLAATDASAEFQEIAGVAYDGSEAIHVRAAVKGVIALLYKWAEAPGTTADKLYEEFQQACESVARVTGRNRITPTTTSVLTPSDERQDQETVRPDTDRPNYDDLIPDPPKP